MTTLTQTTQTQRRNPGSILGGVALAVALIAGATGVAGLVGAGQTNAPTGIDQATRDTIVLKAAQEWEARYRQMYPNSR